MNTHLLTRVPLFHELPLEELQHGIELIECGGEVVRKVMLLPNG